MSPQRLYFQHLYFSVVKDVGEDGGTLCVNYSYWESRFFPCWTFGKGVVFSWKIQASTRVSDQCHQLEKLSLVLWSLRRWFYAWNVACWKGKFCSVSDADLMFTMGGGGCEDGGVTEVRGRGARGATGKPMIHGKRHLWDVSMSEMCLFSLSSPYTSYGCILITVFVRMYEINTLHACLN